MKDNNLQQPDRFLDLVDRYFAGQLTDDEALELVDLAEQNAEDRRFFADQFLADYLLRLLEQAESEVLLTPSLLSRYRNNEPLTIDESLFGVPTDLADETSPGIAAGVFAGVPSPSPPRRAYRLIGLSVFALSLLTALTLAVLFGEQLGDIRNQARSRIAIAAGKSAQSPKSTPLARIVRLNNARWKSQENATSEWNYISEGDRLQLESGSAEIIFETGVQLILEGPAEMSVLDAKRIRFSHGKLAARVGQKGIGFTIETPSGTIVDQGTEFGLDVASRGEAKVVVFRGNVDVYHKADPQDSSTFAVSGDPVSLNAGEGLLFRPNVKPEPVAVIESDYFLPAAISRPPVADSSQCVISSVRDNIRDGRSKKFYEIVPRGFGEDVPAYVDRAHEWNGITTEGIPAFLLGADMVRTFNEDKFRDNFQMTVTLSAPARLFVLLDERSGVADWLKRDFTQTPYRVGQDQGIFPHEYEAHYDRLKLRTPSERTPASFAANRLFAVGPGNSVDHVFTVWERNGTAPGEIVLGELPAETERDRNRQSFYGIIAVPVPSP